MRRVTPPSETPHQLRLGTGRETTVLVRAVDCYALHGAGGSSLPGNAILVLEDGAVTVFRGTPTDSVLAAVADDASGIALGPVYAAHPGGSLAVPTGRVLLRFEAGMLAEDHRADILHAGYSIEGILAYAPEAAWVRPAGGGIGAALLGLPALEAIPGVAHVEPQLLMKPAPR